MIHNNPSPSFSSTLALLLFSIFSIHAFSPVSRCYHHHQIVSYNHEATIIVSSSVRIHATRLFTESQKNANDDDHGWSSSTSLEASNNISQSEKTFKSNKTTTSEKEKELASLRNQLSTRKEFVQTLVNSSNNNDNSPPKDRDLFIPIFAIVALVGFFGAYGYEMLRLYSRGELYLPWNN